MPGPAIAAAGLSKRFGGVQALTDLNLEVARGEVVGYLGPNGAGKTTTIPLLLGLIRPTAGHAEIFGLDSGPRTVEAHRRLAYVPGEATLWPSLTGGRDPSPAWPRAGTGGPGLPRPAHRAIRPRSLEEGPRLLQGQPPEADADRSAHGSCRPAGARRAHQRARPADGADVPRVRP